MTTTMTILSANRSELKYRHIHIAANNSVEGGALHIYLSITSHYLCYANNFTFSTRKKVSRKKNTFEG